MFDFMPANKWYQQLINGLLIPTRVMNSKGKWFVIGAICIELST